MEIFNENVLGEPLKPCCNDPMTGFFRNGFCQFDQRDPGEHTICVIVTESFLEFSKSRGNDLSTPHPEFEFPGLKEGDKWCLCARRWVEAYEADMAPKVVLNATHHSMLNYIDLETLKEFSYQEVV